jgi:uncharacterized protein YjiS (DUF1127 family)
MSLLQDATTATERSSNGSLIASIAQAHRNARVALVDDAAERKQSQLRRVWQVVCLWLRRHSDRAILRSLSARDLHDFCPTYTEAEAEMNKPFWRA